MKRFSSLLFVACMFTLTALAQEISSEQSLHKAVEMISEKSYAKQVRGEADFALVHTQKSAQNGKALYYVFGNEKNGGFVITGADHRANSVLGYTENGTYEQALAIPAFRSWLSSCEEAMQWLSDKDVTATQANLPKFNIPDHVVTNADNTISLTIPGRHYAEDNTLPTSVEPLLGGIVWNQRDPFNRLCPDTQIEENGVKKTMKCATGCVATAVAQVMKYWEWPKQGTGSFKYTSQGSVPVKLEADFSKSVYDWENMLDDYSEGFTDEQGYAVAKLMSDVGIGVRLNYDYESGTAHDWTTYALGTFFGYNKGIKMCNRSHYTYAEWNNLLKKELSQSRPIVIGGDNLYEGTGHEFALDGYNEDGNYHINWGWGGLSNGYFDINYLDPEHQGVGGSMGSYPANQQINVDCYPDKDGTSVAEYQIITTYEPDILSDGTIVCGISNIGLGSYTGEFGYVAVIDDETIVGETVFSIEEFSFGKSGNLKVAFDELGVTPEMIGDKMCKIYPVYTEGNYYKIPLSKVAFQNYVLFYFDADGNIRVCSNTEENAMPLCKSIEFTRDYAGYNVKAKASITNLTTPTFDRGIFMIIYDENDEVFAQGRNFAFIEKGADCELEFNCKPVENKVLEAGKTYNVVLLYGACGNDQEIPFSQTTITMKDPGAKPSLSYSGFALDKDIIAPNEELTVSFDIENTGGFGIETFAVAVFRDGITTSLAMYLEETDIPKGKTTFTKTIEMDFDEGGYSIGVYKRESNGQWRRLNQEYLRLNIKDSGTSITDVTTSNLAPAQYYDLQGRRVTNPTKGLYIVDGKKVVKE